MIRMTRRGGRRRMKGTLKGPNPPRFRRGTPSHDLAPMTSIQIPRPPPRRCAAAAPGRAGCAAGNCCASPTRPGGAASRRCSTTFDDPLERYNMPDTLKAQHIARLTAGLVLYSDMGRVLCSIVDDTVGWHDPIGGCCNAACSRATYGEGTLSGDAQRLPPQRARQLPGGARQVGPRPARPRRRM